MREPPPGPTGTQLTALVTILHKEVRRFVRIWIQTLLPPAVTTALYFLIFGHLIGERIGAVSGVSYLAYIVPGVILMAVITNAYGNVVSSFFSAKLQHYVEELLVAPVANWVILVGYVGGGVMRGLAVAAVVSVVAVVFAEVHLHDPWVVAGVVILTTSLFALAGFINAIFAKHFDDISLIPTFVLTPLTYLGGVFYSVDMLPAFWREVSALNPILYMVNAFRYGLLGVSDVDLAQAFAIMLAFNLLLGAVALHLLRRGTGIKS
jgi:ABC-2 type transport system permease protein